MAKDSPFGETTRLRVLDEYFRTAGAVTPANAWEHVYRTLLWPDERTGLAHVYDANHMQPGGTFYKRAVRFTDALCARWGIPKSRLGEEIDYLFKGCVAAFRMEPVDDAEGQPESELIGEIAAILGQAGMTEPQTETVARQIETVAKDFFTIGNKRKNALGEGFEDVMGRLLRDAAQLPADHVAMRSPLYDLPGFRKAAPVAGLRGKRERMPKPDIAIIDNDFTYYVITAKWSMRQDRERQFANEYNAYVKNLTQKSEVRFALVTNEFDLARLDNVARAQPDGAGYLFHTIYHVNLDLLRETHGTDLGAVGGWIKAGKIASLEALLETMGATHGQAQTKTNGPTRGPSSRRRR